MLIILSPSLRKTNRPWKEHGDVTRPILNVTFVVTSDKTRRAVPLQQQSFLSSVASGQTNRRRPIYYNTSHTSWGEVG